MKGIKVEINGKTVIAAHPEKGVSSLIITKRNDEDFHIHLGTLETNEELDITRRWLNAFHSKEVKVEVSLLNNLNLEEITKPLFEKEEAKEELINKEKVNYFYKLKKELLEKGLIDE